jgi:beta-lactamase superfamily II metal-dependent hydrolase
LQKLIQKWHAAIDQKNPKVVADAFRDRAVPNLSSIALHLACGRRTALLTGDARGDHLLAGLETAGLLAAGAAIHVDVLKLPHHGSQNNAAPALFERIRADHYVISTDGMKHNHPNTATLEWLVGSRRDDERYTIHLTNPIPSTESTLQTLAQGRSFEIKIGVPRTEIALTEERP